MGKIKSRNQRVSVTSGISSALNAVWSLYAATTTAGQLPAVAERLRKMMADPPFELPYILAAISVGILLWSFWPSKGIDDVGDDDDKGGGSGGNTTHGDGSHIFSGNFHGPVSIKPPTPPGVKIISTDSEFYDFNTFLSAPEGVNLDVAAVRSKFMNGGKIVEIRERKGKPE